MSAETFSQQYVIPQHNVGKLRHVIALINKRAAKLKMPQITLVVSEPKLQPVHRLQVFDEKQVMETVHVNACDVTIEGTKPVLSGYQFLGRLEHLDGSDEPLIRGIDVPLQFTKCPPKCDHCNTVRQRTNTFVLKELASGDFKQVGKTCMSDFFNGDDPFLHTSMLEVLVEMFNTIDELRDPSEPGLAGGGGIPARRVLEVACAEVRHGGYLSKEKAEQMMVLSTADLVRMAFSNKSSSHRVIPVIAEDEAKAGAILDWLRSDEMNTLRAESTFMHNLAVLGAAEDIADRHVGIMAAAVAAYDRHQNRKAEAAFNEQSNYVGVLDGKIEAHPVTVVGRTLIPGNQFGDKMLYRFRDSQGNLLVWFNTGREIAKVGDRLHISATIKEHGVYRDVRQTTLLRVTAAENKLYDAVNDGKPAAAIRKLAEQPIAIDQVNFHDGRTALMAAARTGRTSAVQALLEAGADPNVWEQNGYTAAHFAAALGYANCLLVLEDFGADLELRAVDGSTPYSLLQADQAALRDDVRKYSTDAIQTDERVWQRDAEFPLKGLVHKQETLDWFTEECARHEAEGKGDLRWAMERHRYAFDVVIDTSGPKPVILNGLANIAFALSEGAKSVSALVGVAPAPEATPDPLTSPEAAADPAQQP